MDNPVTLRQCKVELEKLASEYPQYQGQCAEWIPAVAIKDYATKGGVAMVKGDVVLVDPDSEEIGGRRGKPRPFMLIFSGRRKDFIMVDKRTLRQCKMPKWIEALPTEEEREAMMALRIAAIEGYEESDRYIQDQIEDQRTKAGQTRRRTA